MTNDLAIQLYSLRYEKDFVNNLKRIAEIGYKGVEFAGYQEIPAKEMSKYLNNFGLKAVGSHVSLEALRSNLEWEMEYNIEVGNEYIICPWTKPSSKDEILALADEFNKIGEKCKKNNLCFCYHNHNQEFVKYDGEYFIDILYANTDSELVKAEFDVYWISYAGVSVLDYLSKYKDRLPLIHLKELKNNETKENVTIGKGIIDFKTIIESYPNAHYIVEQEHIENETTIWDSIMEGHEYIINL